MSLDDLITAPVLDFSRRSGLGVTKIYALINAGEIESVTVGRRRLIILESYHRYLDRQRGTPATKPVASPPKRVSRKGRVAA